jgi:hypothetical protein
MAESFDGAFAKEPGGSNIDAGLHQRFGLECASKDISAREWLLANNSGRHQVFDIEFVIEGEDANQHCPLCNLIFARLPKSRNLQPLLLHGTRASVVFEEHGSQERIFVRLRDEAQKTWATYGRLREVTNSMLKG